MSVLSVIIAMLTLNFMHQTADTSLCPPKILLGPCDCSAPGRAYSCYANSPDIALNIKSIFTDAALVTRKSELRWRTFKLIGLYDDRALVEEFDDNVFAGFQFETIFIRYTRLQFIHPNAFYSTHNYTDVLRLGSNQITNSKQDESEYQIFNILSQFTKLTQVDLSDNRLQVIPANAFRSPQGVELQISSLSFRTNLITEIGNNAFSELPHLRNLDLSMNKINQIGVQTFPLTARNRDTLLMFEMYDNGLTEQSFDNTFRNVERKIWLNIFKNNVSFLPEQQFSRLLTTRNSSVRLAQNPLVCNCEQFGYLERLHRVDSRLELNLSGGICKDTNESLWTWLEGANCT